VFGECCGDCAALVWMLGSLQGNAISVARGGGASGHACRRWGAAAIDGWCSAVMKMLSRVVAVYSRHVLWW
jgi:hypothetical protein